jgi:histidine triad (HIT) family protein
LTEATGAADCIFCKIASGELGTQFVAESDHAVAFRDLSPQAPTHILVVPRRHLAALRDFGHDDGVVLADLMLLAATVARQEGLLDAGGYRVVTNDGPEAGQTVFHAHFHVLGGRSLAAMG